MKKLTLSVVTLTMTMMSYGQTQCKSLTKDSVQCKNSTKAKNSLCYLHNPYFTKNDSINCRDCISVICVGFTKSGRKCKNKTRHESKTCHHHRKNK